MNKVAAYMKENVGVSIYMENGNKFPLKMFVEFPSSW